MGGARTGEQRALVRAAAERVIERRGGIGGLGHLSQARGTLAALDWVEGWRDTGPSTGERRRADELVEVGGRARSALGLERGRAADFAAGGVRPVEEDRLFHDGAWALLGWAVQAADAPTRLAIDVPGLEQD